MSASVGLGRTGLLLTLLFGWCFSAEAQELSWAQKLFEKQNHDFGVVARGADVNYRFRVRNPYAETVHISDVRTTCGCSAAKIAKYTLAPGEETYLEVAMDTRRFIRKKESGVVVKFTAPRVTEIRLPLKVYIRTDVVFSPGAAKFGAVDFGSSAERKIDIAYAGRNNWKILKVKTTSEHLETDLKGGPRGNGRVNYTLRVKLKPGAPAGNLRERVTLVTNDARNPFVPMAVTARIEADVTITPAFLSIGRIAPGESKFRNIVIRGKKPFAIEKIECESNHEAFKVRLPKTDDVRPVHVLPLTFTAPKKLGPFKELFTLTIVGRPEPITFRAAAEIVDGQ
jgi:hypothetical protein